MIASPSTPFNALTLQTTARPKARARAGGPEEGNATPWLLPTSDFLNFDKYGSVALPALGATSTLVSFQVPQGRNGRIAAIGIDFTVNGGAAFTPNVLPAQLTFSLFADQFNAAFPDFGAFSYLPGSVIMPVTLPGGLMIKEGQTITLNVTNNTIVVTTQFVAGRLLGYFYPKKREPAYSGNQ